MRTSHDRWRARLGAALVALALAGCGTVTGTDRPGLPATLMLAGEPSAADAGIFLAIARGYDEAEGVELTVRVPRVGAAAARSSAARGGASADGATAAARSSAAGDARSARALERGRVDLAILSARRLAAARAAGDDLVAIAAISQRPLNPSDGPLLLCVRRLSIDEDAAVFRATIRALRRGYGEVGRDPQSAVAAIRAAVPRIDERQTQRELDAIAGSFTAGVRQFGDLRPARLAKWVDADALVTAP